MRHFTERRVRAHVAVCVYATIIEALIAAALRPANVRDPDLPNQHLTCPGPYANCTRPRRHPHRRRRTLELITRPNALQARLLNVLDVDTTGWDRPYLTDTPPARIGPM